MDLSRIKIEPRLRTPWQAIDLGFVMARRWWLPLALSWAIPSLVLFVIVSAIFPGYPSACFIAVWWFKPLWDRLPIMLASRALFSEPLDVKALLRQTFSIYKRDWFSSLTWRRLSPTRSFDIPVGVLEGLRGGDRSRRLSVLHQSSESAAIALTLVCSSIEYILVAGLMATVYFLVPIEFDVDWWSLVESENPAQAVFLNFISWLCMVAVAPFYTLAGFSLYISRRIELEGWDIEIRFRHLIEQHKEKTRKKPLFENREKIQKNTNNSKMLSVVLAVSLLGAMMGAALPQTAWAQEQGSEAQLEIDAQLETETASEPKSSPFVDRYYEGLAEFPSASASKDDIVEILSGDDFYRPEKIEAWEWKEREKPERSETPNWLESIFAAIQGFIGLFLGGFEILFWLIIVAVIAFVIYRFRDSLSAMIRPRKEIIERPQADILFGLDVRKESLPDNITEEVSKLWQQKLYREAVGLLYRASLSGLVHQFSFEFFDGYTEQECVDVVSAGSDEKLSGFVKDLTRTWQLIAYAHQTPDEHHVKDLCTRWDVFFAPEDQDVL